MRIESPRHTERFGLVRINDAQQVLELDSGRYKEIPLEENVAVQKIEEGVIRDFEGRMAIVIPIKDEKLELFEGVISGIPHECLIIVVSNSERRRVDQFRTEKETLKQFCHSTRHEALIIHQKDPVLARALAEAGYTDILGEDELIRDGKAEGMVVGIFVSMIAEKDFVGFIDADNYFPGAVWEYARCYASGFSMVTSPYSMVRVLWRYKPKITAGMFFNRWGRVSEITNRCMNALISSKIGFETEIIKTGNAGEHAMSLRLAEILTYASGYAVESQELISIFEGFGGILPAVRPATAKHGVEVLQTETRNPHLHEERGGQHLLVEMLLPSLGSIYHSPLCGEDTKQLITRELLQQNAIESIEEPPKPRLITPPHTVNLKKFTAVMAQYMNSYLALEEDE